MKRITFSSALLPIMISSTGAVAATLAPNTIFEGIAPAAPNTGAGQPGHVSIQSWQLAGPKDVVHEIPLRGFYVAHLLSGDVSTTTDGEATTQPPGAYWIVKAGATLRVKVLSEFAVIETIVVTKH